MNNTALLEAAVEEWDAKGCSTKDTQGKLLSIAKFFKSYPTPAGLQKNTRLTLIPDLFIHIVLDYKAAQIVSPDTHDLSYVDHE